MLWTLIYSQMFLQVINYVIRFWIEPNGLHISEHQVNSYFRGFFTRMEPVKNAVFTGFDIFYPVKNTVKVHRVFHRFFHRVKTHRVLHWLVANCFCSSILSRYWWRWAFSFSAFLDQQMSFLVLPLPSFLLLQLSTVPYTAGHTFREAWHFIFVDSPFQSLTVLICF